MKPFGQARAPLTLAGLVLLCVAGAVRYLQIRDHLPAGDLRAARFVVEQELFVALAAILLVVLLAVRRLGPYVIAIAYGLVGTWAAFVSRPFCVFDEACHFGYAAWLMAHPQLPLTTMVMPLGPQQQLNQAIGPLTNSAWEHFPFYEAVQPPSYYILVALIGSLFQWAHSTAAIFFVMRFVSVGLVAAALCFVVRAYRGAIRFHGLEQNDLLFGCILGTLALSPLFLFVTCAVTNDALSILLGAVMLDALVRLPPRRALAIRNVALLGVLGGALWLTKATSIWMIGLPLLLLPARGAWAPASVYCLIVAGMALPLQVFNYVHYHAMSGIAAHLEYVLPMVNPTRAPLKAEYFALDGPYQYFIHFMDIPPGLGLRLPPGHWLDLPVILPSVLLACGCILLVVRAGRPLIARGRRTLPGEGAAGSLTLIAAAGCILPFLTVCATSAQSRVPMIASRYGFLALFCYAMAMYAAYQTLFVSRVRLGIAAGSLAGMIVATGYYLTSL